MLLLRLHRSGLLDYFLFGLSVREEWHFDYVIILFAEARPR
jgi:hypothetical protein